MHRILIGTFSFVIAGGCAWLSLLQSDDDTNTTAAEGRKWVKLTFGLDEKADEWDGRLSVQNGQILQIQSWSFERDHKLDAAAGRWQCSTFVNRVRELATYAEPFRGLLVEVKVAPKTVLNVRTTQGDFDVALDRLAAGRPIRYLDDRASAELLPATRPLVGPGSWRSGLAQTSTQDDFPTIAVDDKGHRWVAWIGYDHQDSRDDLLVLNLDDPRATTTPIDGPRLRASPLLLGGATDNLWLFWIQPHEGNWDIFASQHRQGRWSQPVRITTDEGSDFHLAGATGPEGELWLAWQSFRNGNGDVYAKCLRNDRWSKDIRVTGHGSNQWEPSISVDRRGRAWVAYDSYENGNYDIFLNSLSISDGDHIRVSPAVAIATSEDFEGHASVQATGDRVWIAYDAAGPNWGKDLAGSNTEYRGTYTDALHANRRVELRAYQDGLVWKPNSGVPQRLDTFRPKSLAHKYQGEVRRFYELPQLARDETGRLWVFFRLNRQGYAEDPEAALWEIYATTYVSGEWLEPILLPESWGRQNQRVAAAVLPRRFESQSAPAGLYCAWSRGHHMNDAPQKLRVGRLPRVRGDASDPPVAEHRVPQAATKPEPEVRSWPLQRDGKTYQVYFGDLHRHTDISWCYPTIDGSPVDAFRYALDAARLDFLAITDHTRDTDPYPWWYTQKSNDLFNIPKTFTTIYGYERSNTTPGGGHRNVFFVQRDWPVYRSEHHYRHVPGARPGRLDPPAALYPHLRGKRAFTAAHTPAYSPGDSRGTWSYNDDEAEPLVEIFQGFRRSYERPEQGLAQEASIWYALNKGYRLGFIASSDHVSTHVSFACVWAEENSREALFEAMRSRRTYAATDKIILDVRIGDALMGEQTTIAGDPELSIHVRGTAPIDELQIVRNASVIWQSSPGERETRVKHVDRDRDGPAWYYVRVRQEDGGFAWGSPIWVNTSDVR